MLCRRQLIYAVALYTFYITTHAIVDLVKYRRYNSPIMTIAKEQEEVKKIRQKYMPDEQVDKMEQLRRLDAGATQKGVIK